MVSCIGCSFLDYKYNKKSVHISDIFLILIVSVFGPMMTLGLVSCTIECMISNNTDLFKNITIIKHPEDKK